MLQKLGSRWNTVLYFEEGSIGRRECILPSVASKREYETRKHVAKMNVFCRQTFEVWQALKQTVAPKVKL